MRLYISRLVLQYLGVIDYGIYVLVGGFVTLLTFINGSLSTSTQRFLNDSLGKNDSIDEFNKIYIMSININFILSFIVLILAETVGLWFLNNKLNIPTDRMFEANWVYQFSILTVILNLVIIPYQALLIVYEQLKEFAFFSIFNTVLKLIFVLILLKLNNEYRLIWYSFFMLVPILLERIVFFFYIKIKFPNVKYVFLWHSKIFKKLFSFSFWNIFGQISFLAYTQGINVILNLFFGPVINTARGISYQIHSAINSFVINIQTAYNPQITQSYSSGRLSSSINLIFQASKYSFLLIYVFSIPIIFSLPYMLSIWLHEYPDETIIFSKLILINAILESLSFSIMTGIQASGNIKRYVTTIGLLNFLNLPISYLFLYVGFEAYYCFIILIFITLIAFFARYYFFKRATGAALHSFYEEVVVKILPIVLITLIVSFTITSFISINNIFSLLLFSLIFLITAISSTYFFGLSRKERILIKNKIYSYV